MPTKFLVASMASRTRPAPTPITLANSQVLSNGSFQFSFTNRPGTSFSVLATTDPVLPLESWTLLGGATEVAPGRFQFIDKEAANFPQRWYRLRSP